MFYDCMYVYIYIYIYIAHGQTPQVAAPLQVIDSEPSSSSSSSSSSESDSGSDSSDDSDDSGADNKKSKHVKPSVPTGKQDKIVRKNLNPTKLNHLTPARTSSSGSVHSSSTRGLSTPSPSPHSLFTSPGNRTANIPSATKHLVGLFAPNPAAAASGGVRSRVRGNGVGRVYNKASSGRDQLARLEAGRVRGRDSFGGSQNR